MKKFKKLLYRVKPAQGVSKYTAFIKVAGIKIPKSVKKEFLRAASGEISHDDLRAEFLNKMGLSSD